MGSFCTALFGSSQSTTTTIPENLRTALTEMLDRAATQSSQPYPQYTPETAAEYANYTPGLVAPMTPDQIAAGQTIAGLKDFTSPYYTTAMNFYNQAATPIQMRQFSQDALNQYMSPYLNNVVNAAVGNINQTNAQQQQQVLGSSIGQGAYGGDRAGIAQAELARQQNLANNATIANLYNTGYGQAMQQFNTQQAQDLATQLQNRNLAAAAGTNVGNLGSAAQQAALQQAQAQYQYGTSAQQQQQANLSTAYQQFLNQQGFPYQQLSYYAGILSGAAPAFGSTTTVNSPTQGYASQAMGAYGLMGSLGTLPSLPSFGFGGGFGSGGGGSSSMGLPFFMNKGGRVGFAEGGVPTNESIQEAYQDYLNAISTGAPYDELQRLYARYQQAFRNAPMPAPVTLQKKDEPAKTDTATETKTADTSDKGGKQQVVTPGVIPDYQRSDIGTKAYPQGGREIIEGPELSVEPNQTINGLLRGNAPLITGDYPAQTLGSGLGDLAKTIAGIMIPGVGLVNALNRNPQEMTDQYGNLYGQQNRTALPRYDSEGNRIRTPNTASGQTLSEFMSDMNITDPSKVRMGMSYVNGYPQPEFFVDSAAGRALHPNSVSALDVAGVKEPTEASQQNGTGFAPPGEGTSTGLRTPGQFSLADLASIGKAYGLPAGYLEAQAQIESDLNPNAKSPYSTAAGLYQIIKKNYEKAGIDPYNPEQAATWTAQNATENALRLKKEGYEVNNANLALAHNFGIEGALALLSQPQRSIFDSLKTVMSEDDALAAVTGNKYNISDPSATALGRLQSRINAATEALGPLSTQQPGWMQPRGTNITNEHPQGIVPPQISDQNIARSFEKNATSGISVEPSGIIPGTNLYDPTQGGGGGKAGTREDVRIGSDPTQIGSLDRTGTETDTSTVEPGSSLGPRGLSFSPSNSDLREKPDVSSEPNETTGETKTYGGGSDTFGIFNHGGRIKKAEAGGISMQYGLPTEEDLQRIAASAAGSGAYALSPTQQALGTKGIIPSKRGGRIHKQDAGGIGIDEESPDIFQRFSKWLYPDTNMDTLRNEMMGRTDTGEPKYRMPQRSDFYTPKAGILSPNREPPSPEFGPRTDLAGYPIGQPNPATEQAEYDEKLKQLIAGESSETSGGPSRRYSAVTPGSQQGAIADYMRSQTMPAMERNAVAELENAPVVPTRSGNIPRVGPIEAYGEAASKAAPAQAKTQAIIPKGDIDVETMRSTMESSQKQPAATAPAAPAGQQGMAAQGKSGSLIEPAGDTSRGQVGGEGYRKYIAPTPYELRNRPDMQRLMDLKFFSSLIPGQAGATLANAANNYARDALALQSQQEAYQKGQVEAAKGYSEESERYALAEQARSGALKNLSDAAKASVYGRMVPVKDDAGNLIGFTGVAAPKVGETIYFNQGAGGAGGAGAGAETFIKNAAPAGTTAQQQTVPIADMQFVGPQQGSPTDKNYVDPQKVIERYAAADQQMAAKSDMNWKTGEEAYKKKWDLADTAAANANTVKRDLESQVKAYTMLNEAKHGSFTGSGAFAGERQKLAYLANTLINIGGNIPADQLITEKDISSGQLFNKFATLSNANRSAQEAWGRIQAIQEAYPNIDQTQLVRAVILSSFLVSNQEAIDKANFMNAYGAASNNVGLYADSAFREATQQAYQIEKDAIAKVLLATGPDPRQTDRPIEERDRVNMISELLDNVSNPKTRDAAISSFDKVMYDKFGIANMHRIFLGGR